MKEFTTNMTNDEKCQYLHDAFKVLRQQGRVKTWTDFAELLETNRSVLSAAKNGQEKYLTDNLMSKVDAVLTAPQVNISHSPYTNVATGQSQITIETDQRRPADNQDVDMIPVIPLDLYKESDFNILEYVTDEKSDVCMSPAVQQFPSTTCYYQVVTSAMFPHFHQGDILALKAISRSAPIVNGEVYAIDTKELGILVRFAYDRGDSVEMRSTPERQDRFESFLIHKSDIYTIFRVVGLIRTNI